LLNGEIVNDRSPKDRGAAMVFQSYALYPHLDVYRNIAFPLEVAGVKRKEIDTRVREIAARLEIDRFLERRPRDLSGGQRQRVALGRALVRRTRLCLFDEPLSNLDPSLRELMRGEIKRLHEEGDSTYLYVTHDQIEALTMSDQMVVMEGGIVQQVAPPREVYERPANMFVAGFVGSPRINLVRPATLGIPEGMMGGRAEVVVGVRPEDVFVGAGVAPAGAVPGRVYVAELVGASTWVTLEIAGERVIGHASADFVPRSGAPAWARVALDRVHFFDPRTTKRIAG
jgi:multiple sugar transport system ATP-binding protein